MAIFYTSVSLVSAFVMWYDIPMPLAPLQRVKDWWRTLPADMRFPASVLGICGVVVLILSTVYMREHVLSPFRISNNVLKPAQELLAQQATRANELESSKTKDTDRDGLSDYSELYVYRTSPYLSDTDSDGIPDAIEIAQGTDPNCPTGTVCTQLVNQEASGPSTSTFGELTNVNPLLPAGGVSVPAEIRDAQLFIEEAQDSSQMTPAQIKDALIKYSLVTADQLKSLSDEELRTVYTATYARVLEIRQSAAKAKASSGTVTSTSP